ncbi:MAG: hypothetical protein AB7T63_03370 [Planctomycetota bacterium]
MPEHGPLVLRLAFLGAWQSHRRGSWNEEVAPHADLVLPSRSLGAGKRWLRRRVEAASAASVEVRLVGYSWGAVTAGHLASDLLADRVFGPDRPSSLFVRLGLLDPVGTLRKSFALPAGDSRLHAWCVFQRNGCYQGCPGPSALYRGHPVRGADNRDVTHAGLDVPPVDHVPPERAPDHLQLGYRAWGGFGRRLVTVLGGEAPWAPDEALAPETTPPRSGGPRR